jgi:hypothetical protein
MQIRIQAMERGLNESKAIDTSHPKRPLGPAVQCTLVVFAILLCIKH